MAAKKKSRFDNKFKSTAASDSRTANVRTERKVKDDLPKLSFNFKDFDFNQCPPGQTLEKWQESNMLDKLLRKFIDVCACTRPEAEQKELLKVYGKFPTKSQFKIPKHIEERLHGEPFNESVDRNQDLQVTSLNLYFILFSWTKITSSFLQRKNTHKID